MKMWSVMACAAGGLLVASGAMAAPGGEKVKPSVQYARSWDAAVEEAKLLNMPIVVHSHGFY